MFLTQFAQSARLCAERGIKVVVNAGGLNPAGLADRVRALLRADGIEMTVAHIEGDDIAPRLPRLRAAGHRFLHLDTGQTLEQSGAEPVSANAYLGGWGIAAALARGADVVIAPRVTDAALVLGVGAW